MVQGHVADMALDVDAAALLVYRAAWTKDTGAPRVTREAAMAKLYATDHAQQVIDKAVQLHGGDGVRKGHIVESLYREIRALRIYEGASDVQKVVIARQTLANVRRLTCWDHRAISTPSPRQPASVRPVARPAAGRLRLSRQAQRAAVS
jgi:alkylation response protein AidB-like acyl-CoA dehydrogenase